MQNLLAFRIQNYRSIVDSRWQNLSVDNITGMIGQNESGKTTILEALHSFSSGAIEEDILRSNGKMPIVSCSFCVGTDITAALENKNTLPKGLTQHLRQAGRINIERTWSDLKTSTLSVEDADVRSLYDAQRQEQEKIETRLNNQIESFAKDLANVEDKLNTSLEQQKSIKAEILNHDQQIDQLAEQLNSTEDPTAKKQITQKKGTVDKERNRAQSKHAEIINAIELHSAETKDLEGKNGIVKTISQLRKRLSEATARMEQSSTQIKDAEKKLKAGDAETKKAAQTEVAASKNASQEALDEFREAHKELIKNQTLFRLVCDGKGLEEANKMVFQSTENNKELLTIDDLVSYIFHNIPSFEFFEDFRSLLPNSIDLENLTEEDNSVEGYFGVINFLLVAGLSIEFFKQDSQRIMEQQIEEKNEDITVDFQDFWRQKIGKTNKIKIQFELKHHSDTDKERSGKPYIVFWIKDGREKLYPKQRSKGVRWFLSFYLQLKAYARSNGGKGRIILVDEPGISLHARAQEDVLKVFEDIKDKIQIIYSTHSPHLLKLETIYRLLAIQRADSEDEKSETQILTAHELGAANVDTLSPLYTLMGASFADQEVIKKRNNVILEEVSAFYYLASFFKLCKSNQEVNFLPATGCSNVPQLANLFLGWGLDFIVVLDDDGAGRREYNALKRDLFGDSDIEASKRMIKLKDFSGIEDVFTKTDFKKHVLQDPSVEVPSSNSEFLRDKKISKAVTALKFYLAVQKEEVSFQEFNKTTHDNISMIVRKIESLLNARPKSDG